MKSLKTLRVQFGLLGLLALCSLSGCMSTNKIIIPAENMPRELKKTSLPDYVIEPPDVLLIDMVTAIPKPPYVVQPLDSLSIKVLEAPPDSPIMGVYPIELDGSLNLGPFYGSIPAAGKTLEQVKADLEVQLLKVIKKVTIELTLAQGRGLQQVRGQHLVRADGTISLGNYGAVRVVGMTLAEAKEAIQAHLGEYFQNPEISIDMAGFNSKVYYIVFDTGGSGQPIQRLPVTGNETVLDALSQVGGLIAVSDPKQIWVARPSDNGYFTTLPVDWKAVTECADSRTNYQVMPGDRIFIRAYPLTSFATQMERVLYPFERILGVSLLSLGTVRAFENQGGGIGGVGGFGF